jgi:hypothetical protein
METFTQIKEFVGDPSYDKRRVECLSKLDLNTIDAPLAELISGLAKLPYCFSLQSCYGHFLHDNQNDDKNTERLPSSGTITNIEYRIAYIALCIQDNKSGRKLFHDLRKIPDIDSEYIQFGCAEWFWERQVNSYTLQVEPARFMYQDKCSVDYQEALHIEKIRSEFFNELRVRLRNPLDSNMDGSIQ